jgi:hypothetical protein
MHANLIITRVLDCCLSGLHAKRAQALRAAVLSLLLGASLSLSGIARGLYCRIAMRHRIKRADRLLGNRALWASRHDLYQAVAERWLVDLKQLLIVVDWSDMTADQKWHLLRASVAVEGRSVTLYEEVHPQEHYGHPRIHKRFLKRMAQMVPPGCQVIVMTDAGFRSSWFQLVAARGWDWVGRIRNRDLIRGADGAWRSAKSLYSRATTTARDWGCFTYVRSNPIACRLVLIKQAPKGRHRLNIYGKKRKGRHSTKNAASQNEPWLLASSKGLAHLSAQAVVKLYSQRMRIEQSFRDIKNQRVGMGLSTARSRGRMRLEMLLLLAHLTSFVLRLIGEAAKQQQLELQFQSTNRRQRREISVMTLARRLIDDSAHWLKQLQPWLTIPILTRQARYACSFR